MLTVSGGKGTKPTKEPMPMGKTPMPKGKKKVGY